MVSFMGIRLGGSTGCRWGKPAELITQSKVGLITETLATDNSQGREYAGVGHKT